MSDRILVVDDEPVLRSNVARFLKRRSLDVDEAPDGETALALLEKREYTLLITDLRMPGIDGIELLRVLSERWPETLALIVTAHASVDSAVAALRLGAQDYVLKPLVLADVGRKVDNLLRSRSLELQVRRLRSEVQERFDTSAMVGSSPAMARVLKLIRKAGPSPATVLIQGESGTGKELAARALHDCSKRRDKDFIGVNLAAQPAELVDAMLFGHERGAFTGASGSRQGVFRAARGGTVFMDEVGDLPAPVQVKLLRVLESREVQPLGSDRPVSVDFRLITATHRDLATAAAEGNFREDLYYRLNVFRLDLPPLRDRREDVLELATHFARKHARSMGRRTPILSTAVQKALVAHGWPGNIRELSNVMERAVLLCEDGRVGLSDLPPSFADHDPSDTEALRPAMDAFERAHILAVLARHAGDKVAAAKALDVHLATLYRRLDKLGIG